MSESPRKPVLGSLLLVAAGAGGALWAFSMHAPGAASARPDVVVAPESRAASTTREPLASEVPVVVYTTSWCPHCRKAQQWLDEHGVAYQSHDVEEDPAAAREHRVKNPRGGVPTIVVDGEVLTGFSPNALDGALTRARRRRAQR